MTKDEKYMNEALKFAHKGFISNEIPIGCVIVKDDKIISSAFNNRESTLNATNHAEILAISKACKKLHDWRLSGCDIYVTLEPCLMCLGAMFNARIKRLVFGAYSKTEEQSFISQIYDKTTLNHKIEVVGGVLEKECEEILVSFFKKRRTENKNNSNINN